MDKRVKFIARVLMGEKVAGLAREFGISRKTAYKIIGRYHDTGLEGLIGRRYCHPITIIDRASRHLTAVEPPE